MSHATSITTRGTTDTGIGIWRLNPDSFMRREPLPDAAHQTRRIERRQPRTASQAVFRLHVLRRRKEMLAQQTRPTQWPEGAHVGGESVDRAQTRLQEDRGGLAVCLRKRPENVQRHSGLKFLAGPRQTIETDRANRSARGAGDESLPLRGVKPARQQVDVFEPGPLLVAGVMRDAMDAG